MISYYAPLQVKKKAVSARQRTSPPTNGTAPPTSRPGRPLPPPPRAAIKRGIRARREGDLPRSNAGVAGPPAGGGSLMGRRCFFFFCDMYPSVKMTISNSNPASRVICISVAVHSKERRNEEAQQMAYRALSSPVPLQNQFFSRCTDRLSLSASQSYLGLRSLLKSPHLEAYLACTLFSTFPPARRPSSGTRQRTLCMPSRPL